MCRQLRQAGMMIPVADDGAYEESRIRDIAITMAELQRDIDTLDTRIKDACDKQEKCPF